MDPREEEAVARRERGSESESGSEHGSESESEAEEDKKGSWSDWESDEEAATDFVSFDGRSRVASIEALWSDCRALCGFDFPAYVAAHRVSFYDQIRLVNFLRRALGGDAAPETRRAAAATIQPDAPLWRDDGLLVPALPEDAVLRHLSEHAAFDGDDEDDEDDEEEETGAGRGAAAGGGGASASSAAPAASAAAPDRSRPARSTDAQRIGLLELEVEVLRRKLEAATRASSESTSSSSSSSSSSPSLGRGRPRDAYYFESYDEVGIHEDMLKDAPRTLAYRDAIEAAGRAGRLAGARVFDIGCGTGILSLFAARAGASHVVALDLSLMINEAREAAVRNGFTDRISFVHRRLEEVDALPEGPALSARPAADAGKVDVLVSEWMGYALLYESMLSSVLTARDRFLRRGGMMLPDVAEVQVFAVGDPALYESRIGWWKDVYGFDMTHLRRFVQHEPAVMVVADKSLCSECRPLRRWDLLSVTDAELDFEAPFELPLRFAEGTPSIVHGIGIAFDVEFTGRGLGGVPAPDGFPTVTLSTSPHATPTHWKQTLLWLPEPLAVDGSGVVLKGALEFRRDRENPREYHMHLRVREPVAVEKHFHLR